MIVVLNSYGNDYNFLTMYIHSSYFYSPTYILHLLLWWCTLLTTFFYVYLNSLSMVPYLPLPYNSSFFLLSSNKLLSCRANLNNIPPVRKILLTVQDASVITNTVARQGLNNPRYNH